MRIDKSSLVYVSGHRGMVGSAAVRALRRHGYQNLLLRSRNELDLTSQSAVRALFDQHRPRAVILAAARVGGIHANNSRPAEFIHENLLIQDNVIDTAYRTGVEKLVFLGSSCIYPKFAPQPIKEDALLSGALEPTNEWYAIAKIAGIKMCQAYRRQYGFNAIALMPTNLYGMGDNFHPQNSHVLPALIRRFHEAKMNTAAVATAWGSGTPRREFLHVDDLAEAIVFLLERYDEEAIVNVGCGEDITIRALCELVMSVVGYAGRLEFDPSKPDGTPRKLLDTSKINALGWYPRIPLERGIHQSYAWFCDNSEVPGAVRG
jgi:GDP-L-fucose synthase